MSNAFSDVVDDDDTHTSVTDSSTEERQTPIPDTFTDGDSGSSFTDGVQPTVKDNTSQHNDDRYEDPETGDKADDTDPRGLFRKPTINELRYYAREGPYGKTIITKPIDDAFKHGFEIDGDNTNGKIKEFLDENTSRYKEAKVKSRRDGIAVLMHVVADTQQSVESPIQTDNGSFQGFKLWTVDNLSDDLTDTKVANNTDYNPNQIYVSQGDQNGGVAIVDDVTHPDHGEVVGYGIRERDESDNTHTVSFVHADRCHHFVNGKHVDGQLGNNVTGRHIGESVLTPVLQPLKATQMGFWAISQILFRYSAPLHAVEPPESWSMDDFNDAREKLGNISMASDAVLPPGSELSVAEGVSEFDPEPYYNTLEKAICAGTIFTTSVLQGTQSGTVSGSETDMKGYFNGVQVLRQQEIEPELKAIVKKVSTYDQATIPRVASVDDIEFDWGPLFKLSRIEQAEGAVSLITAATNGIKNYVLTPDEARSLISEEWATFDVDVDLDDLTEDDMDMFDRINMNEAGQGSSDNDPGTTPRNNPRLQNGGGQPEGQTREQSNPTTDGSHGDGITSDTEHPVSDSLDELSTDELQAELERRQSTE